MLVSHCSCHDFSPSLNHNARRDLLVRMPFLIAVEEGTCYRIETCHRDPLRSHATFVEDQLTLDQELTGIGQQSGNFRNESRGIGTVDDTVIIRE